MDALLLTQLTDLRVTGSGHTRPEARLPEARRQSDERPSTPARPTPSNREETP